MADDWVSMICEFHVATDCARAALPAFPDRETVRLRLDLMEEELRETVVAVVAEHLPDVADGLADLIYVAIGTAISFGIDLRPVMAEVHRANLSKAGGTKRADGKVQKPASFRPPDIAGILKAQRPIPELAPPPNIYPGLAPAGDPE
jgi:predicted HAD superfamily Cof-like phosphohydrolase